MQPLVVGGWLMPEDGIYIAPSISEIMYKDGLDLEIEEGARDRYALACVEVDLHRLLGKEKNIAHEGLTRILFGSRHYGHTHEEYPLEKHVESALKTTIEEQIRM
ncbi:hypothetical protein LINPERPRIM_LOCUS32247 [Linum perenne]